MSRRVNQITIEGKQIRQAVNVGPRGPQGPQGPQGRGLEINTVVNTPADLPPTAPPGHTVLILSSNTVSVWASGAWRDLGGPVQGEPPDLGQLRADHPSPGGIIPPDAIIHWAKALTAGQPQNGVNSYGGTIAELSAAVLGNISVTSNSNGVSFRIAGDFRFQICVGQVTFASGGGVTRNVVWTFPQDFGTSSSTRVFAQPAHAPGVWEKYGPTNLVVPADHVGLEATFNSSGVGNMRMSVLAIGQY